MNTTRLRKNLLVWYLKFTLGLMVIWIVLYFATIVFGAEPRSVDDLLKDRAEVRKVMTGLTKSFQAEAEEFNKLQSTKDHNAKIAKLRQAGAETEQRLRELDTLIAEQVAKEREGKKKDD